MSNFKKKKDLIESIIIIVLATYVIFSCFFFHIIFKNSYKSGDLTFYYNELEKYGIQTNEDMNEFYKFCDEIAEKASENPFYKKKRINIIFSDSYFTFAIGSVFQPKAMGTTATFFNYSRICLSKTDLKNMSVISSSKENNIRDLKSVLVHEITHSYMTNTLSIFSKIIRATWKEEGICEVIAGASTYDVNEGITRLLNHNLDSGMSWRYFTYRMCVSYMMKREGLTFEDVMKDKRKQSEIITQLSLLTESELRELL